MYDVECVAGYEWIECSSYGCEILLEPNSDRNANVNNRDEYQWDFDLADAEYD